MSEGAPGQSGAPCPAAGGQSLQTSTRTRPYLQDHGQANKLKCQDTERTAFAMPTHIRSKAGIQAPRSLARGHGKTEEARALSTFSGSIVPIAAGKGVAEALGRLGRTEDIHFSPDGKRLAIAGFNENRILILDVAIEDAAFGRGGSATKAGFSDHLEISSPCLDKPHGVFWIDDRTLIVANRQANVDVFALPAHTEGVCELLLEPIASIGAGEETVVSTPGSVAALNVDDGMVEVLVCNNYAHTVTSHVLDGRRGFSALSNARLLDRGLAIPDSVAVGPAGAWIAVSNHSDHSIFLYKNEETLGPETDPQGILRGVLYPHGLRFSPNGKFVFVADAGAPFVHVYLGESGDWSGDRYPVASLRVMDDQSYRMGRGNPQEGGPKGLDLSRDGRLLVVTCEMQPLVCMALDFADELTVQTGDVAFRDVQASGPSRAMVMRRHATLSVVRGGNPVSTEKAAGKGRGGPLRRAWRKLRKRFTS